MAGPVCSDILAASYRHKQRHPPLNHPTRSVEVLTALSDLLSRLCEQPQLNLSPEMALEDVPGLDSLRLLQAVALLEERFGVEVDVVAINHLRRVQDIINLIKAA
jgi:acyl carrier protein